MITNLCKMLWGDNYKDRRGVDDSSAYIIKFYEDNAEFREAFDEECRLLKESLNLDRQSTYNK